jgi:hypothetical protein
MTLAKFHAQREILEAVARMGVALPPPTDVDEDAPPAYAEVNPLTPSAVARWIASCPDCPGGTSVRLDRRAARHVLPGLLQRRHRPPLAPSRGAG